MKVAYHRNYVHPVPAGHKFPMEKYSLLREQLLHEGICELEDFFEPEPMPIANALLVHNEAYVQNWISGNLSPREQRKTGFTWSPLLVERELTITQGTISAAEYALEHKLGFNIAGGTHHAYSDRGEGFCLLNDFAVAASLLLEKKLISRAMIIDLDVHQGNGSAEILKDYKNVFTFSVHCRENYPLKKEISDLDIELNHGIGDQDYLEIIEENIPVLLDSFNPDIVFYQSGVDVLGTDKLGKFNLSTDGCLRRDQVVYQNCFERDLPLVTAMGGGYSPDIKHIIKAHVNTFRVAKDVFS